jgi:hypothetical protein
VNHRSSPSFAVLLALTLPVAAITSYLTARTTSRDVDAARDASIVARVERLEQIAAESTATGPRNDERSLVRRVEALEARLRAARPSSISPTEDAPPVTASETAPAAPDAGLHAQLTVALSAEPVSSDHGAAIRRLAAHLVQSAGPPLSETEFAWAAAALRRQAHRDRITPGEAAELAKLVAELPVDHAARATLATAVAMGWGQDERLGGLLSLFEPSAEASLHQGILAALDDEHPSAAFSEYIVRLVGEARDPGVLAVALGLDRIEAAATAAVAPRLVKMIEGRLLDGSLDVESRAQAGFAIAVASLRAPGMGVATLRQLADREPDADTASTYRRAATELEAGNATLKSLERLFEE